MAAEENGTKKFLSRGTIFNIVALGIVAFGIYFCYCYYITANRVFPNNNRRLETLYTICHPLKGKYDIKDYHVKTFVDGSMGVEYVINNPELAFDIMREIDTLRKDSIYLSKALLHIHIRNAQPGGIDFRVELPGELGYESKRDDELYRKLNVDRFKRQEVQKEIREKHPESEETDDDTDAAPDAAESTLADGTEAKAEQE